MAKRRYSILANLGAAVAPLLVAPLIVHWGWRSVFYSLLVPGLLLALLVYVFIKDRPAGAEDSTATSPLITFKQVLTMPALLWGALALFFTNIAVWGLMNWLPTYLLQARGFSIGKMGMFALLPAGIGAVYGGSIHF